jgi:hypothetical protein
LDLPLIRASRHLLPASGEKGFASNSRGGFSPQSGERA